VASLFLEPPFSSDTAELLNLERKHQLWLASNGTRGSDARVELRSLVPSGTDQGLGAGDTVKGIK